VTSETSTPVKAGGTPAEVRPLVEPHLDLFAVSLLTFMCVCLAVGQVAIKVANAGITPLMQAGLRSLAAAVLVGAFAWVRGIRLFSRDRILWPALLTSLFFAAEFGLLYPGLALTTAGHAVVLLYTSPFFVALGAHFLIPGDRLTSAKLIGLLLAMGGVAAVMLGRAPAAGSAGPTLLGDLLCLGGAMAWGGLTLTIRASRLAFVAPQRVTFIQLIVSGPLLCLLSVLLGEAGFREPTPLMWAAFAFTVVFVAGFVFTMTTWLLARYAASRVMSFMLLTPVFGVIAAHVLLGEAVGEGLVVGLLLVLAGLWLINRPARARG
jgi:drug/metabolite transporter (DMT)-like permease